MENNAVSYIKNNNIQNIINNIRHDLGLNNKDYVSNFIFEDKMVENVYLMKRAMADIYKECFDKYEEPSRIKNWYYNKKI